MQTVFTALILLSATLSSVTHVAAADAVAGASGTITVTGHSELKVHPDVAYVSLEVITQNTDQVQAVSSNSSTVESVRDALTTSDIPAKDIVTEYYTVSPTYDYQSTPPTRTGYQVVNGLKVTLRNLAKVGLITDKAVAAGATQVGGITFDLADRDHSTGVALVDAVTDAQRKADLVAGAAGYRLGRLLAMTEQTTPTVQPIFNGAFVRSAMAPAAAAPTTSIAPQDITVTADVSATYAIDYTK